MNDGKIATTDQAGTDGGDVAETRNPDTIQREIEQTRAELADTIDAIADRISPKRAASRGAQAVKSQVSAVFNGGGSGDSAPAAVVDAAPGDAAGRHRAVEAVARGGGGAAYAGTTSYAVERRLRTDRVLLVIGAAAAAAGVIVLWRSRR